MFSCLLDLCAGGEEVAVDPRSADPEFASLAAPSGSFRRIKHTNGLVVIMDLLIAGAAAAPVLARAIGLVAELVAAVPSNSAAMLSAPGISAVVDLLSSLAPVGQRPASRRVRHPVMAMLRTLIRYEVATAAPASEGMSPGVSTLVTFVVANR